MVRRTRKIFDRMLFDWFVRSIHSQWYCITSFTIVIIVYDLFEFASTIAVVSSFRSDSIVSTVSCYRGIHYRSPCRRLCACQLPETSLSTDFHFTLICFDRKQLVRILPQPLTIATVDNFKSSQQRYQSSSSFNDWSTQQCIHYQNIMIIAG